MYENTLNIALNRTCIKDLNENVLHYVYLTLFWHFCAPGVGLKLLRRNFHSEVCFP